MRTLYKEAIRDATGASSSAVGAGLLATPPQVFEGMVKALVAQRTALNSPEPETQKELYTRVYNQVSIEHPGWTKTEKIAEAKRRIQSAVQQERGATGVTGATGY
jgi:hypothetical protein